MKYNDLISNNVRVRGAVQRAVENGYSGHGLLVLISNFENVESYKAWVNRMKQENPIIAYIVERIGGNGYRAIRKALRGF